MLERLTRRVRRAFLPLVGRLFHEELVRRTDNFSSVRWLGHPIWQNVLDLWVVQEAISEVRPELLIECGTYRGGSALFFASLLDLLGRGRVITIDLREPPELTHPRVEFVQGSSISEPVVTRMRETAARTRGPVMVVLDSDHRASHVARELELYAPLVTPGSFLLVQDGIIDLLPSFREARPGPLPAIRDFLARHPEFAADVERSRKFVISHHPLGWLRRRELGA